MRLTGIALSGGKDKGTFLIFLESVGCDRYCSGRRGQIIEFIYLPGVNIHIRMPFMGMVLVRSIYDKF